MKKGFSQIELLMVIGLLMILFLLGGVVSRNFLKKDQLMMETRKIESLINEARIKTVAGFMTDGGVTSNFGIYFEFDRYFLFPGESYDSEDQNNQEFAFPSVVEASTISLPNNSLIFEKITGEVKDFDPNQNFLMIRDQESQSEKKISFNQLGTVVIEDQ